uniref:Ovule protein n=1 Tax=Mesocestoides corti TaxID=53468 RepID=A0A5K3G196_MESCO
MRNLFHFVSKLDRINLSYFCKCRQSKFLFSVANTRRSSTRKEESLLQIQVEKWNWRCRFPVQLVTNRQTQVLNADVL